MVPICACFTAISVARYRDPAVKPLAFVQDVADGIRHPRQFQLRFRLLPLRA